MRYFYTLLFVSSASLSALAQGRTITPGTPQAINYIQITNNTHPADTAPNPSVGTWGKFVKQYKVSDGPCLAAGAIRTQTIASGGTGYAVGDTGTIASGGAVYKVFSVSRGVVTAITFSVPYGSGYTISSGVTTTATTGSGTGLTLNITGVYTGTPGPSCVIVVDQTSTGAWVSSVCNNAACSNGDSITFTSAAPASSALDGTARIAYSADITNYGVALATPGSRQTPGGYLITPTGGGGTGMLAYVTVSDVGSDAGTVVAAPQIIETGTGYTSCPRFVLSGTGGTPATFTCTTSVMPGYALDISISAPSSYYQLTTLNDTFGMAVDQADNVWGVYSVAYSGNTNSGQSYVAIHKSTNGGVSYGSEQPLLIDTGTHCGGGATPCSYVTGALATAPNGNLVVGYWEYDITGITATPGLFLTYCNPAAVDCTKNENWSAPYTFPITIDPAGFPLIYDIYMTSNFPHRNMAMGVSDIKGNTYIAVSCDDGKTWSTGFGCVRGTKTFINVTDPIDGFTTLPTNEVTFGWIGGIR